VVIETQLTAAIKGGRKMAIEKKVISMRQYYDGTVKHVYQQAHNREHLFSRDEDKVLFLKILDDYQRRFDFSLMDFALMQTHFHLLLLERTVPTGKIMGMLKQQFTRLYNLRHGRSGTLYNSSYQAIEVWQRDYYYRLLPYIAYNPVKAKLVKTPETYPWLGYTHILKNRSDLIAKELVLRPFAKDPDQALVKYKKLMADADPSQLTQLNSNGLLVQPSEPILRRILISLNLSETDGSMVRSSFIGHRIVDLRKAFIMNAITEQVSFTEIARFLNVSYETVRRTWKTMKGINTPGQALDPRHFVPPFRP
jgi:putative transposase